MNWHHCIGDRIELGVGAQYGCLLLLVNVG